MPPKIRGGGSLIFYLPGPVRLRTLGCPLPGPGNTYFTIAKGLSPHGEHLLALAPADREAVRIAIEVAMALWPHWGSRFRAEFKPQTPIAVNFRETQVEV